MKTFIPRGNIFGPIIPEFLFSTGLSFEAIIMYAILCNFAGNKDHCWPSYETLYRKLGQKRSIRSIKSYIAELEEKHFIEVVRGKYKSNIYYLIYHDFKTSMLLVNANIEHDNTECKNEQQYADTELCDAQERVTPVCENFAHKSAKVARQCANSAPCRAHPAPKENFKANLNTTTPPCPPPRSIANATNVR